MSVYTSRSYRRHLRARWEAFLDWLDNAALALSLYVLFIVTVLFLIAPIVY